MFIIHGWEDTPESNWIPWLRAVLERKGFSVHAPLMPDTEDPKIEKWVHHLADIVGLPDKNTYFVAHSMGCQAVLRYLEQLRPGEMIGGAVFVAGFLTIRKERMAGEAKRVLSPWVERKIDLRKAKPHAANFVSIVSDNDPYIALDDSETFKSELGSKIIVIPGAGHFTTATSPKFNELHAALNELQKMSK